MFILGMIVGAAAVIIGMLVYDLKQIKVNENAAQSTL